MKPSKLKASPEQLRGSIGESGGGGGGGGALEQPQNVDTNQRVCHNLTRFCSKQHSVCVQRTLLSERRRSTDGFDAFLARLASSDAGAGCKTLRLSAGLIKDISNFAF